MNLPTKKIITGLLISLAILVVGVLVLFTFDDDLVSSFYQQEYSAVFWEQPLAPGERRGVSVIEAEERAASDGLTEKIPTGPINQNGIKIPEVVNFYQGEILSKEASFLKLKLSSLDNLIETDQEIEVRFDEKTIVTRTIFPAELTTGQKLEIKTEEISPADLRIGEQITVTSRQNIAGKTAFRAESIRAVKVDK